MSSVPVELLAILDERLKEAQLLDSESIVLPKEFVPYLKEALHIQEQARVINMRVSHVDDWETALRILADLANRESERQGGPRFAYESLVKEAQNIRQETEQRKLRYEHNKNIMKYIYDDKIKFAPIREDVIFPIKTSSTKKGTP